MQMKFGRSQTRLTFVQVVTGQQLMISRFFWSNSEQLSRVETRGARDKHSIHGWLVLITLTVLFVLWLVYRLIFMPAWPSSIPGGLIEFFDLMETATGATLAFLWAGLYVRNRRRQARLPDALTLDELYALDPIAFEHYVAALFRQKGYRVVLRGGSGDHGVDLELLGREGRRAIVQCKRYQSTLGEDVVRDLYGTLIHEQAGRAFLVTTADISDAARTWAFGKPITLIDGPTLVQVAASLSRPRGDG
jgi:hypothetical protein